MFRSQQKLIRNACPAGDALDLCGKIAVATGATLVCENAFARLERGAGLPCPVRLPYFPQDAEKFLAQFDMLVTVDARVPVAMFGYDGGPSALVKV